MFTNYYDQILYQQQQKKRELAEQWSLLFQQTTECEKNVKYLDLARELKKMWNMKVTIILIVTGGLGTVTKGLVETEEVGNNRTSGDHPNYCNIEIGENNEKRPGDLRRLVVTQNPVRNNQLTLMWKTIKRQ